MTAWLRMLNGDPLPWLLEDDTLAVRHLALRQLLDRSHGNLMQAKAKVHTEICAGMFRSVLGLLSQH